MANRIIPSRSKKTKKQKKNRRFGLANSSHRTRALVFSIVFGLIGTYLVFFGFAAPNRGTSTTPTGPLAFTQSWGNAGRTTNAITAGGCFGVDSSGKWSGSGVLAAGESYTFTPEYFTCASSEQPVISMNVGWMGNTNVKLEMINPFVPGWGIVTTKSGPQFNNNHITAPVLVNADGSKHANLCIINDTSMTYYSIVGASAVWDKYYKIGWSMTLTNTGTEPAAITATGYELNGWINHAYPGCRQSDSDADHWNDMLEAGIQHLTESGIRNIDSKTKLYGSNFAAAVATSTPEDEIDTSPADFNDDGVINQTDVDRISRFLGQGTGVPMDQINHSPGPLYLYDQSFEWRRYDIDGDGQVTQHDLDWVRQLIGSPVPATRDLLSPWAVLNVPASIQANIGTYVSAYAVDNDLLSHVDFYVGSGTQRKLVCQLWASNVIGYYQPQVSQNYYQCGISTGKRAGAIIPVTIDVYDTVGHTYSTTKTFTTF